MLMLFLCPGPADAVRRYVPCQFSTIQAAVNDSDPGDTVMVAPGVYTGSGNKNIYFWDKDVTILSEGGAQVTTIDCEGSGRAFSLTGGLTRAALVSGFTIVNGHYSGGRGGAVWCGDGASPTIENIIFESNYAGNGGGSVACASGANPVFSNCVMSGSWTTGSPGGAVTSTDASPEFIDCTVEGNTGSVGGGMRIYGEGTVVLTNVTFRRNNGGAVYLDECTSATLVNCAITGHEADRGGAVHSNASGVVLESCVIDSNDAVIQGGGVWAGGGSTLEMTDVEVRCNVAENGGGGVYVENSDATFTGCTFYFNYGGIGDSWGDDDLGGGVYLKSCGTVIIDDCRFERNTALSGGALMARDGMSAEISSSVFANNWATDYCGAIGDWGTSANITNCTFRRNGAHWKYGGIGCKFGGSPQISHCLIAYSIFSEAVGCDNSQGECFPVLECCDLYGNEEGDWVGCVEDQLGVDGNFSADPLFCSTSHYDVSLSANSPCLSDFHPPGSEACGLIGAGDVGCGTTEQATVVHTSWSGIKALYRN